MITVDTRGTLCPQPLILTKRAIDAHPSNTGFEVLYDNETAKGNLLSFLAELNIKTIETLSSEGIPAICFTAGSGNNGVQTPKEESITCPTPSAPKQAVKEDYVVAVRSEFMGGGDDKLGAILLRAFINTLPETDHLPTHILLYNSGIKIALEGMDTVPTLQKLADAGVKIIACGTCLDFYEVKAQLAVGQVGNMYVIADTLVQASHIVYP